MKLLKEFRIYKELYMLFIIGAHYRINFLLIEPNTNNL